MKILFTHSYFQQLDPKQVAHAQPYPPLGTIWAAALLREQGFQVALADTMFAAGPEFIMPYLSKFLPDVVVIYDDGFNYLTKMCLSNMRHAAFAMQQMAKAAGCRVVVCSSDATDHADAYLEQGADVVIAGEGEYTLLELMQHYEGEAFDVENIKGVFFRKNNALVKTVARPVMKHLDELPLPAWDLIEIEPYRKVWLEKHGYFSINMATTRGCPYKCNWCAKPIYGNAYHMRGTQQVVDEIKWLRNLFSMDHIWFADDIFGLKRSWVTNFAQLVNNENVQTAFKIQSRADLLVQEHYVQDLAAAGCTDVWMGAESGAQKVLDAMDKGTTVSQIKAARALLKKNNIKSSFFLQYGYPGETKADIKLTLDLLADTLPDDIGISVSYPLPGTVFYERVKSQMSGKSNWQHSNDLDIMFEQTYSKAFYRKLHRYTHIYFRKLKLKSLSGAGFWNAVRYCKYYLLERYHRKVLNSTTNGN